MGRYTGPRLKKINRLGELPLFSKKKAKEIKDIKLGYIQKNRKRFISAYSNRLLAKQQCCYNYGLRNYQLKSYVKKALYAKGLPAINLYYLLESRLDTIICRKGIASTLPTARQLITHGHIKLDNKIITIPSYHCKNGQIIEYKKIKIEKQLDFLSLCFNPILLFEYYCNI